MFNRGLIATGLLMLLLAGLLLVTPASGGQDKKKVDLQQIPKKVLDALKAKFPMPEITTWTKEKEAGDIIYDIEFTLKGRKCEADIKEDGTIVNFEMEIAAKDLPKAVTKAVESRYPKSSLKEILEITDVKGKQEKLYGYEIVLETTKGKSVEVTVAPDGKILEDDGEAKKEEKKEKK